jgi:hypothetical protein
MTIAKAMSIWKINSGTQGIEEDLERQFKNITLLKLM